jgi:hypothetical protein
MALEEMPLNFDLKNRVSDLMFALAKYRANFHPRRSRWHEEDSSSVAKLDEILSRNGHRAQSALSIRGDIQTGNTLQIEILSVIGDYLLGAAA